MRSPTVGAAVQNFSAMYQHPRGISLSPINIHRAREALESYPLDDVRMIVATDSSAILGIGDQGYGGLAIPIGKLALYTVGGGVSPFHTMPVALDVGTERLDLINDPYYLGPEARALFPFWRDHVASFFNGDKIEFDTRTGEFRKRV